MRFTFLLTTLFCWNPSDWLTFVTWYKISYQNTRVFPVPPPLTSRRRAFARNVEFYCIISVLKKTILLRDIFLALNFLVPTWLTWKNFSLHERISRPYDGISSRYTIDSKFYYNNNDLVSSLCYTVWSIFGPILFCLVHPTQQRSVSPSVRQSVSPSVRQSVSPSVRQSVSPSVRQSVSPSVRQSVSPSVRQSVSPSVRQSVSPSVIV